MVKSPIFLRPETEFQTGNDFDAQVDFSQLVEEARKNLSQVKFENSLPNRVVSDQTEEGKKSKKSWKSSLFSWLKFEKKIKPHTEVYTNKESLSSFGFPIPRCCAVSGPIYGSIVGADTVYRSKRPTSGPLTGLFTPTRKRETEVPYMCLDQLNHLRNPRSFGPIYLVN